MKTALKTALTATVTQARRIALLYQIRALEIRIYGQDKSLSQASCPIAAYRKEIERSDTRRKLVRIRAEYNATFPAGIRRTWRMA